MGERVEIGCSAVAVVVALVLSGIAFLVILNDTPLWNSRVSALESRVHELEQWRAAHTVAIDESEER